MLVFWTCWCSTSHCKNRCSCHNLRFFITIQTSLLLWYSGVIDLQQCWDNLPNNRWWYGFGYYKRKTILAWLTVIQMLWARSPLLSCTIGPHKRHCMNKWIISFDQWSDLNHLASIDGWIEHGKKWKGRLVISNRNTFNQ